MSLKERFRPKGQKAKRKVSEVGGTSETKLSISTMTTDSVMRNNEKSEADPGGSNIAMGVYKHPYRIPKFIDDNQKLDWLLNQMAGAFRVFAKKGFCEGPAGHISVRDPTRSDTFWINPLSVHFSILTPQHMVHVDEFGTVIGGNRTTINAAGFKIHSTIHKARPDVNVICHVHSKAGKAFSVLGSKLDMLTQDSCIFFNNHTTYNDFGGVVLDSDEAVPIAAALGSSNRSIILKNHGLLTVGSNVGEAAYLLTLMDNCCEVQIMVDSVQGCGRYKREIIPDDVALYTYKMTASSANLYSSFCCDYEAEVAFSGGVLKSVTSYHND
jgi:ribulose-5-phosphate 4-epimerase/fuculose-1-phosphate aldolase